MFSVAQNLAQASAFDAMLQRDAALWNSLVGQAQDPVVARAMMELFEARPELMAKRAGAFLAARVTVQRDRIRYAKAFRQGQRVGAAFGLLARACAVGVRLGLFGAKALVKLAVKTVKPQANAAPASPTTGSALASRRVDPDIAVPVESAEILPFPVIDWGALDAAESKPTRAAA